MNIGIVGGGIAGLSLALALQEKGIEATVFEAAPELDAIGAGIMLATNAMFVYRALGVDQAIADAGRGVTRMLIADAAMRPLTETRFDELMTSFQLSNIAIHRGRLQKTLLDRLNAPPRTGHRLVDVNQTEQRVTLRFDNGVESAFDAVIGADGIRSTVRASIIPSATLRPAHQRCWRGIASMSLPEQWRSGGFELWGRGTRIGFAEIAEGEVYWFALLREDDPIKSYPAMKTRFADYHGIVQRILDATDDDVVIEADIADLAPLPRWHAGRLCLIGDAAHATTPNMGQGACQAIEDAFMLGRMLSQHTVPGDCFTRFQAMRFKRVNHVVRTSRRIGQLAHVNSALGEGLRNAILRATPKRVSARQVMDVIAPQVLPTTLS